MRINDLFRLSTRMFKTRPMRTWLTIVGVGVGIAATYFLVSLGYGLQKLLLDQITTSDSLVSLDVYPPSSRFIAITPETIASIASLSDVAEVTPVAQLAGQMTREGITADVVINVTDAAFFRLDGRTASTGRLYTSDERGSLVVSSAVPRLLNIEPAQLLGQVLTLTVFPSAEEESSITPPAPVALSATIVGIIEQEGLSAAYLPWSSVSGVAVTSYSQAKVKVRDSTVLPAVREAIKNLGYTVSALSDTIAEANKVFRAIQFMLALFGIVALVVASIGMFNTVTIALLERTQEIGIMKALGGGKADIFIMLVTESALMGFLGGLTGLLLGYLGGEGVTMIVNTLASRLGGQQLELFDRPLWFTLTILVFSTTIGFLTGVIPARRAARLNTLEALRYK